MRPRIAKSPGSGDRATRVVIIGDSHIHAIKEALEARDAGATSQRVEAHRLIKMKQIRGESPAPKYSGIAKLAKAVRATLKVESHPIAQAFGDISLDNALKLARRLKQTDVLVSVLGGNQHAVFSTIQHPQPFDFMLPDANQQEPAAEGASLIPYNALYPYFKVALRDGDGETIARFRKATSARMIHLLAPPPKEPNSWIEEHHDTLFVAEGIARQGVSSPDLRLKFWHLQNRAMEEICAELNVEVLQSPANASEANGFLARTYFAGDATHANPRYGELVLQQLDAFLNGTGAVAGAVS